MNLRPSIYAANKAKSLASAQPRGEQRSYAFGQHSRLTSDWVVGPADANREIRYDIRQMRYRSRELERDNDYIRRFFTLLQNNVLGHNGIGLQMKIMEPGKDPKTKKTVMQFDTRANSIIEAAWEQWSRRENCCFGGYWNWLDIQKIVLRSTARDGAIFIKKHYDGPFGFRIEPIEIDHLDTEWNMPLADHAEIRLGVEYDKFNNIQAYWLFNRHPGSLLYGGVTYSQRVRVPADQLIHIYRPERVLQATGVPWVHSSGTRVRHLGAYEEAEVIASRAAASKMAFLERTNSTEYTGVTGADTQRQMEITPGSIEELPPGFTMKPFDPTHPNSNLGSFLKAELRGIASGLGVSYVSLANDLEGVNYSSIRAGLLDEREEWKSVQQWFIDWFVRPVFEEWLGMALARGAVSDGILTLPAAKFDKFNAPEFKPRRWDWVDPLKDIQASVLAIEKGLDSRRNVISEGGKDIEDVFTDQAEDEKLAEDKGLDFKPVSALEPKAAKGSEPPQPEPNAG